MSPLLVFLFAAGVTFSAIYIDALRTTTGLTVPRFVRAILPDRSLGLHVEYQGDHLLVAWDVQSPTVRAAVAGVLQIEDGGEGRTVHLDASQVAAGSILYKPASDDITFHLELYSDQGNTNVESIRVLAPRDAPAPTTPAVVTPESEPKHVSENPAVPGEPVESKRRTRPISEISDGRTSAIDSDEHNTEPAVEPARRMHTPRYIPPVSTPPSATMTKSPTGAAPHAMPDGKTLSLFNPARPLRQVMPNTAAFRSALLDKPVRVTVIVSIDRNGHVRRAALAPGEAPLSSGLPGAALAAAREWVFEPATLHGTPIESQHSIVFEFEPPPSR